MKKLFILCVTLLLLCTGCSKKIESVDANDDQLNAVIAAAEALLVVKNHFLLMMFVFLIIHLIIFF